MVAHVSFPAGATTRIPVLLAQARDAGAYRRVLCVKLALDGKTASEIADVLGWNSNSVQRIWSRYRAEGERALLGQPRGGRHHAYLTAEEEDALLAPFQANAEAGGMLVAGPLQAAYETRVGTTVPKSTVYRLLARHGWRKVIPRRRHPEQQDGVQEQFKRTSLSWWPTRLLTRRRPATLPSRSG